MVSDMATPHHPAGEIDNCDECIAMRKRARAAIAKATEGGES